MKGLENKLFRSKNSLEVISLEAESTVPVIWEAFMNGVWTGIHEHPKNTTWPTPTFPGTYEVRGVHELVMNGHSWTPKKYILANTYFSRYL